MSRMIKKTTELDQNYIDKARLIFEVRTEKEAVNKALEMAVIDDKKWMTAVNQQPWITSKRNCAEGAG